jgi:hypothetical protein
VRFLNSTKHATNYASYERSSRQPAAGAAKMIERAGRKGVVRGRGSRQGLGRRVAAGWAFDAPKTSTWRARNATLN